MGKQKLIRDLKRKEFLENKREFILSTLTEQEFKLKGKSLGGRSFNGEISKEGFNKLL